MTPAERIAELRTRLRDHDDTSVPVLEGIRRFHVAEDALFEIAAALLALAEAVPVLLATVSEGDRRWMSGPMVEAVDRLAAAWAALGDDHE